MPKNVKGGPLGVFEHPLTKMKGDIKEICEKKYHKAEKNLHKSLVEGGTRTHILLLGRPQKAVTSMQSASAVVWHSLVIVPVNL